LSYIEAITNKKLDASILHSIPRPYYERYIILSFFYDSTIVLMIKV